MIGFFLEIIISILTQLIAGKFDNFLSTEIKAGVNISHKNLNFSGTASENFKTFPDNCQESRWAGKHHVLHDAFRSTATCRGSSVFFFLICQIRIPKFLETLQDFVPLFSRNSQNCSKKSPNSKTIPSQL